MKQIKNRGWILFSITSSLFFAFQIAGFALSRTPLLRWTLPFWLIVIFGSLIPGFSFGIFLAWLLERTKDKREEALFAKYEDGWLVEGYRNLGEPVKDPLPPSSIAWLIILVAYVPAFLAFYPGICSHDSFKQLAMYVSGLFGEYQPNLHTLILYMFWDYGREMGNVTTGIAIFTAFQMVCLSGAFAYAISLIKKMGCRKLWYWVLTAFGALFPYNMYMALTVNEAALFTATFLPAGVLLLYFFGNKRESLVPEKEDIIYTALLVPIIAFVKNSRYAIYALALVLLVVMIILAVKKNYDFLICIRILISTILGVAAAFLLIAAAGKVLDVKLGEINEIRKIPGYQTTDNTESSATDSIESFLVRNAGYLYIFDQSCVDAGEGAEGYGFIRTGWVDDAYNSGAKKSSMMPGYEAILEKIASENILQKIPVLGILFVPGYVIWVLLFFAVACWYKKRYYLLIPVAFVFTFILTLFAGSSVQLKVIYPAWVFLPFLAAAIFRGKKRG